VRFVHLRGLSAEGRRRATAGARRWCLLRVH